MKIVSLFANVGVAEAYLEEMGLRVVLANEFVPRRAEIYSKIYPNTNVICGDFLEEKIFSEMVKEAKKLKVDVVMATPPCQGMSTAGQQKNDDKRNNLIVPTIDFIKKVLPKYVLIENVPQFLNTSIKYKNRNILIHDLIQGELSPSYEIEVNVIDTQHYSVPQARERAILLMTKKSVRGKWTMPPGHQELVTMDDVIGDLFPVDPYIKDVDEEELLSIFPAFFVRKKRALAISKWHNPPHHVKRQVLAMMHTPTGKSAFGNKKFKPVKENGELIKGFPNTYKRQNWDRPAYTITMDNVKISSQNNVHPGRRIRTGGKAQEIFSDPRALTLYELMLLMTLPKNWAIPTGTSEAFLRRIIGEGIPPLMVKHIFKNLI